MEFAILDKLNATYGGAWVVNNGNCPDTMETFDPPVECPQCGELTDALVTLEEGKKLCAQCFEDSQYEDDLFIPGLF